MEGNFEHQTQKVGTYGKNYFRVTLPKKWCDNNIITSDSKLISSWSTISKGFLIFKMTDKEIEKKKIEINLTNERIKIHKRLDALYKDTNITIDIKTAVFDYVRLIWASSIVKGINEIVFKASPEDESLLIDLRNYLDKLASYITSKGKGYYTTNFILPLQFSWNMIEEKDSIKYDYIDLTNNLFEYHNEYFNKIIETIKELEYKKWYEASQIESKIDYQWFYASRLLNDALNSGLFLDPKQDASKAIGLSLLYKLIENNSDSINKIALLFLFIRFKAENDNNWKELSSSSSWKSLVNQLIEDLYKINEQYIKVHNLFKVVMEKGIDVEETDYDEDLAAELMGSYAGYWQKKVGEMKESYLTEIAKNREWSSDFIETDLVKNSLFGEYYEFLRDINMTFYKYDYGLILSQIFPELRRVSKFPRNLGFLAIETINQIPLS